MGRGQGGQNFRASDVHVSIQSIGSSSLCIVRGTYTRNTPPRVCSVDSAIGVCSCSDQFGGKLQAVIPPTQRRRRGKRWDGGRRCFVTQYRFRRGLARPRKFLQSRSSYCANTLDRRGVFTCRGDVRRRRRTHLCILYNIACIYGDWGSTVMIDGV